MFLDKISLALAIIGGLNWGTIGLFNFDLVALICGGSGTWLARIIYAIVGRKAHDGHAHNTLGIHFFVL